MVPNKLCWDENNVAILSKQRIHTSPARLYLFCKSRHVVWDPVLFIPYHVIGSCKGPIYWVVFVITIGRQELGPRDHVPKICRAVKLTFCLRGFA